MAVLVEVAVSPEIRRPRLARAPDCRIEIQDGKACFLQALSSTQYQIAGRHARRHTKQFFPARHEHDRQRAGALDDEFPDLIDGNQQLPDRRVLRRGHRKGDGVPVQQNLGAVVKAISIGNVAGQPPHDQISAQHEEP